jgi:hypothetical protein
MQVMGEMFVLDDQSDMGIYDLLDTKFNSAILMHEDLPMENLLNTLWKSMTVKTKKAPSYSMLLPNIIQ